MKPLIVLIGAFALSLPGIWLLENQWNYTLAGNIGMSAMLMFTAAGHFVFSKGMSGMLPESIPFRKLIIGLTGLIEVAAAIGLLVPSLRHLTAVLLVVFFILVLPANVYAAQKRINYQTGAPDGKGPGYLWFRIPLQVLFISWVAYFSL
jgi:uncharacterized membrane protein